MPTKGRVSKMSSTSKVNKYKSKRYSKYKRFKAKMYRKVDGLVHRFKERLRTKIVVNSDTALVPANDDPAGTQYRYIVGKLEDLINLKDSSSVSAPGSGNNKYLNNVRSGGLKAIFDRMKISYIKFKFISPWTSSDALSGSPNNQQATLNLYTFLDKDGVVIPASTSSNNIRSLYYVRERGNMRMSRMNGYNKVHTVLCKPYTDHATIDSAGNATVKLARPLGWFDVQNIYQGTDVGVPIMNLGIYYIECPTDVLGTGNSPAFNGVIDCQIDVYYQMKNII